jgi:hypothetical protein
MSSENGGDRDHQEIFLEVDSDIRLLFRLYYYILLKPTVPTEKGNVILQMVC